MKPILTLEEVVYTYPGATGPALCGATLALPAGRKVCVLGRNGSGKSTLFLHCNGILRPVEGVVTFAGTPIAYDRRGLRRLRQGVGIVFQNPDEQLFSGSVAQDIAFGPLNLGLPEAEARQQVECAAEVCGITALLERPTHALSGGEKTRVALAGVLAMQPEVLMVDEMTASLDPWARSQIFGIFDALAEQGKTVVLATHNLAVARCWAELVVIMDEGRVAVTGTPAAIFEDEALLAGLGLKEGWQTW